MAHYREAHPLPLVITHYINLISFAVLTLSGFYIHYPAFSGFMGAARGMHIFCGIVLLVNLIVRIVLAFVVDSAPANGTRQVQKDYKTWLPQADNRHQGLAWIKFYLFMKKDHPLAGKFGVPQKIAYLMLPLLMLFMGYTGLALWEVTASWPMFAAFTSAVGGLMAVRVIHYFMMFVFIIFIMIHVYMAAIEGGLPLMRLMFLRKEHGGLTYDIDTHAISGEDNSI